MEHLDSLGKRIKFAREKRKLTQAEVSRRAGVPQSDISKLENGSVNGSTKVVQLARALNCDPYWLATGEGETWGQPADENFEFDGRGGNVVGVPVRGASEFFEGGAAIDTDDPATKGVVLGSGVHEEGYALKVIGDRNAPALKDGNFLIIDTTPIQPGDLGLFTVRGDLLLRELLRVTDDAYYVDSPAWGARQTFRESDVDKVETIVAIVPASRWRALEPTRHDMQKRLDL